MDSVERTSSDRIVNNMMRHQYRILNDVEKASLSAIKDQGSAFLDTISALGGSRELSIAKTKIEEAVMWTVKHITA